MLFLCRVVQVWSKHPLLGGLLLVYQTQNNLVELHLEPGTDLLKVYLLVVQLLESMVSVCDQIVLVGECHYPLGVYFGNWE